MKLRHSLAGPLPHSLYHHSMNVKPALLILIRWGGPPVAMALCVAWWISGTTWVTYIGTNDWRVSAGSGLVAVSHSPGLTAITVSITGVAPPKGLQTLSMQRRFAWWFRAEWKADYRSIAIPLWFPILVVTSLFTAAWRYEILARRRALIGCCVKCRYDRKGLAPSAPCPECGATTQVS